ncbi:MAG: DUF1573 domain-containing protein [Syntrophobacteraceae bacterium]
MKHFVKNCFYFSVVLLALFAGYEGAWAAKGSGAAGAVMASPPPEPPIINIPQLVYNFGEVFEGTEVVHEFTVKNTGKGVLNIERVKVS